MTVDHTRAPRLVFIVQGVLLVALGGAGLVLGGAGSVLDTSPAATVLGLQLSPVHSLILLAAGALSVVLPIFRRLTGLWAALQFAIFAVLFNVGVADPRPLGLDVASHFLHLGLVVIASVLGLMAASSHLGGERH